MGRTVGSIVLSIVALSGSFVAAIVVAIVVAVKRQPPKKQLDGADA
ncbi:MAG: hypothetical protein WBB22_04245 [Anaerolineae bacterium]